MRDDNIENRNNKSNTTEYEIVTSECRPLSWGAIFAGVAVAMVIYMMLTLLGIGIGASTLDIQEGDVPSGKALGIGTVIWAFASALIALFTGSWVTGRFTYLYDHAMARALHGVVVWSLVYLISALIVTTTAGKIAGGAASMLGKGLSAAGQGVASVGRGAAKAASENPQQAQGLLQNMGINPEELLKNIVPAGQTNAQEVATNLKEAATKFFSADSRDNQQARTDLVQALTKTGRSETEANQMVNRWEQTYQQAKEQAKEAADAAAKATAMAAFWAFITMVAGLIASIAGSLLGKQRYEPESKIV
ncbi:MAG TPA: hypothetical protein DCZ95_07300 [Verrucomicrobia bacterium]|nr:MAG: hypothetical protein A2X46_13755 [Lentisphaerae bacterium GWF2_57_35]HBA83881.1 hypothetical protein [Verrucomicrobiota bacterium]